MKDSEFEIEFLNENFIECVMKSFHYKGRVISDGNLEVLFNIFGIQSKKDIRENVKDFVNAIFCAGFSRGKSYKRKREKRD